MIITNHFSALVLSLVAREDRRMRERRGGGGGGGEFSLTLKGRIVNMAFRLRLDKCEAK